MPVLVPGFGGVKVRLEAEGIGYVARGSALFHTKGGSFGGKYELKSKQNGFN